ncbi:alpha/beta hydrolase [Oscillatoriales cyanobacterium LEGE 11467]|uniref:Alpha/beta hydrolase n=2 Tax=Zarconia TaxID=2992130 RepID=A0A928VS30_9CYAN|nr:alpha/beta hydrolase [Zarconia navalis LEGE 11467]
MAIETIIIRYQNEEVTITFDDIRSFSAGDVVPEIEDFLREQDDRVQNTASDVSTDIVKLLRDALREEITISSSFRDDIEGFLDSGTGEFLLVQLDRVISGAGASTRRSVDDLEIAITSAIDNDGFISALELIEKFPQDTVRIDASGLSNAVADVKTFVEEIEPILQTVRNVLEDVVCDCDDNSSVPQNGILSASSESGKTCNTNHTATEITEDSTVEPELADVSEPIEAETQIAIEPEVTEATQNVSSQKAIVPNRSKK